MATFGTARMQACGPWVESGCGAVGDALETEMSPDGSHYILCSGILPCLRRTGQPPTRQPPPPQAPPSQATPFHHLIIPPPHEMEDEDSAFVIAQVIMINLSCPILTLTRPLGLFAREEKNGTTTPHVGTKTNNSQDHPVDTPGDENEKKMEGIRSYIFGLATFSIVWTFFLVPYWLLHCSYTTPNISKTWNDVLSIGYVFLIPTAGFLATHALQFKDGKLSACSAGFTLLKTMLVAVLICLLAGTFIPLRVCRRMSNSVVWTSAVGASVIIFISWALAFQQWLPDLSLPECIRAKFKKIPEEKSDPGDAEVGFMSLLNLVMLKLSALYTSQDGATITV